MCGYFGFLQQAPAVVQLMDQMHIPGPYPILRAYRRRTVPGLVSMSNGEYKVSEAFWWFALKRQDGELVPNDDFTSYRAHDLEDPLWRMAIKTRRALVFATELIDNRGSERYLLRADKGFAIGCVYNDWLDAEGHVRRSFAVITRPTQARFRKYRLHSLPLFLPMDKDLIRDWLDPQVHTNVFVQDILENPRLTVDMKVTFINTPQGDENHERPTVLRADDSDKVRSQNAVLMAEMS